MDGSSRGFLPRLDEALALRAAWLESARLPQLRESVVAFRSLVETLVSALTRKDLLAEDRYEYDAVTAAPGLPAPALPADTAIPDETEALEVNRRVGAWRRRLSSLVDEVPASLAGLDDPAAGRIAAVIGYVDLERFGDGSQSALTRALARRVAAARAGRDRITAQAVQEVQTDLASTSREIHAVLAEAERWHRERWKAEVRAKVLPQVLPRLTGAEEERVAETVLISEAFARALPGAAWKPALVHEILGEDQEALLVSLRVPAAASQPVAAADVRPVLRDALRDLCRTARDLGWCMEVLSRNEGAVERPRVGFFRRLLLRLRRGAGRPERRYAITSRPAPGAPAVTETVDFPRFVTEVQELRVMLGEIGRPGGREHRRVHAMDASQLLGLMDWLLRELRQAWRRLEGLNVVLQARASAARDAPARGIRLELMAIENAVRRAETVRRDAGERQA
jgi:hypothetical protein